MVYFDLSSRSMLIDAIVEDEGEIQTEGTIQWLSNNRVSYQGKGIQVVDGEFYTCVGVL